MPCLESSRTTSSLRSWQKRQQRQQQKQEKQRLRRDWDRDFRCQFIAAVVLGAIGAAVSCIGVGLMVYGLPTADRLQREVVSLTEEEIVAAKVRLMLYGRLGGLLLGVGLFLLIVLAVLGTEYRQHLLRQRKPGEDARTAGNRRLYADILRGLRFLWQDSDEVEENDNNNGSSDSRSRRGSSGSRRPPAAADRDSIQLRHQRKPRANSMLLTEVRKREVGSGGEAGAPQQQAGLLGPAWRANEAFDATDEVAAFRKLSHSAQSMRRTTRAAAAGGVTSLQQLFSVETEFSRFAGQQRCRTNLKLNDLVDNDFAASSFATDCWHDEPSPTTDTLSSVSVAGPASVKGAAPRVGDLTHVEPDGAPEF